MASRREYEMMFQLNAELNRGFAGTFSKAQQQLLAIQKDIQALNRTQADISAYQKQQQAVEGTQRKLEVLQQQYDNIQKEIQETGTFSADLENKLLSKQQQIDKTSASLERQTQKLSQMDQSLRDASVDTGHLEDESRRLSAELAELQKRQEAAAESAEDYGVNATEAFEAASSALAAAGIAKGLHEIYEAYLECISIASDFESSMSNVEALSGASAAELQQLSDMAKELGATTSFTAKESADAMGYMAMAGWDAQQMLSGMPGVLQLAAASGEDLANVSDIVTDSMTAFGLSAADTSRYADVLAATAANANTSVGVMGETFKYAAPVAGALGYSVEDVATAIGLMANAGIKGSNAGTALRNVFNGLLDGVTLTGKAFGEAEISAVRADGTMANLGETVDELRTYFGQMTEAEQVANASAIAGQRGYAGLLSILNATEADYDKLTNSINNSAGAAQRMADIKMDNTAGQLTLLNSAMDAVKTTIGEQFTPELQELYGAGAGVLSEVNAFLSENPAVIKGVTTFVGVAGTAVTTITAINAAIKIFKAFDLASLFTGPAGAIMLAGVAVAGVTAAIVAYREAAKTEEDEVRHLTEASRAEYAQLQELKAEYEEVSGVYGENSDQAQYLAWQIKSLTGQYEDNKQTIEEYSEASKALNDSLNQTLDTNRDAFNEIGANEGTTMALVHRLQDLASQTEQTVETQEEMKAIIRELNEVVPDLALSYEDVIGGVTDYGAAIESAVRAQAAAQRYDAAQQGMVDALNAQYEAEKALAEQREGQEAAQKRYNEALEAYQKYAAGANTATSELARNSGNIAFTSKEATELEAATKALDEYNAMVEDSSNTYQTAVDDYERYKAELVDYIELTKEEAEVTDEVTPLISSVIDEVDLLTQSYQNVYAAALESVRGQYNLWDEADEVVATSADNINKALESQIGYWESYNTNLTALQGKTDSIEGLSDVIASFADGSSDSVNAIAGMAAASDEDLRLMVENWKKLQDEQSNVAESIGILATDFPDKMQEIQDALVSEIEAMNLEDEAAESARATINGYIGAAEDMLDDVEIAYSRLAAAASKALGGIRRPGSSGYSGYAEGTPSAVPGYHWVGEEGPELIRFNGGERVVAAEQSRSMQANAVARAEMYHDSVPASINFSPVYQITGNADPADIEDVLRKHDEELKDELLYMFEQINDDRARSAYV